MDYRIDRRELERTLKGRDELIPGRGKVHLVACGGTALTLMGYKESTKDVDFLVPRTEEYEKLIDFLGKAGYKQATQFGWKREQEAILFDLYPGKRVYTTELLTSPLDRGGCRKWNEWKKIFVGILNPEDLVISKMFRGTETDIQDCLLLLAKEKIDLGKLKKHYQETAQYEIAEAKVMRNFDILLGRLGKERRS
ncbi:MAG: DUF6036 family nucleotidyltransferase [Candidatus Omnitrophica bacterium]|nr:DUF6036 family nucleotidyltransferase [Candidatus Omnitrophota bacterium]